jgi:DNA-directed RNA polymerase specialized sigma24 family protein
MKLINGQDGLLLNISQKEYIALKRKIRYIVRGYSPKITNEQVQDVQSSVIITYLQTYPARNLRHLVIDCLRKVSGRKKSCNYQKRMNLSRPSNPHLMERTGYIESVDDKIDLENFVSRLKPFYQTLIKYQLMGYTHPEIGKLIGKTGNTVTVHFHEMNKVISKMKVN